MPDGAAPRIVEARLADPVPGEPSAEPRVHLMTAGAGSSLSSAFGHSSLWVESPTTGRVRAYSFGHSRPDGVFTASGLLMGSLDAGGSALDPGEMLRRYMREGRVVRLQRLDLSPDEVRILDRTLSEALTRRAPYRFFDANCTTRLRDALDVALGGRLRTATDSATGSGTFRDHVALRGGVVLRTASKLFLAAPADRPLTVWEEMFLPATLRRHLSEVRLADGADGLRALVLSEEVFGSPGPDPAGTTPLPAWLLPLGIGSLIGGALVGLAHLARAGHERAGLAFDGLGGSWALVVGLTGLLLAALWAFSDQTALRGNQNLFVVNPLVLLLGVTVWGSQCALGRARALALLTSALAIVGVVASVVPGAQENGPFLAFAIPVHLGLARGVFLRLPNTRSPRRSLPRHH